ncbi:glycoside hydrolase family 13 protein [Agromyces sp. MMS24-K17]|uniref:glycoside hydrolase family 13 protein n=1 Tax=Agromyces sp. MMS24-K17 TaxID=3372850 RepID=UPI003754C997
MPQRLHAQPHHDGSELYAPTRGVALGDRHLVRVRVPDEYAPVVSVAVRVVADAEPRFHPLAATTWFPEGDRGATWWEGAFEIANPVAGYRFLLNHADGTSAWLTGDGLDRLEPVDARDFRVATYAPPPAWAGEQVMYQVFPDRFARSAAADDREHPEWARPAGWGDEVVSSGPDTPRQLFGGDLDGIAERLDHLERLGVTLLYLTPFFPARSNHRYDASSFDRVDPVLGGDAALIRLVEAAHARGIRVIGDLTTNHTGDGHEWFASALGDPDAAESDFYVWTDDAHTEYVAWYGVPSLPKLDWNSRDLRRRFIEGPDSVVAKWLLPPYGLDGWRIDVANMTGRLGADDLNREVQRTVRRTMDEVAPGRVLYAESTNDAARDFDGEGWHAPMSYSAFTRPVWQWLRRPAPGAPHHFGIPFAQEPAYTAEDLVASYRRFTAPYPWAVRELAMNAIDTHDTPRFAERADDRAQLVAAGLSMALPGTPVVFAGDEFGLRGVNGEDARTPLPWDAAPRLADEYGRLARFRRDSAAVQRGGLRWLHADDDALVFVRELADESVLVFATRAATEVRLPFGAVRGVERAGAAGVGFGDAALEMGGDGFAVTASGPAFAMWSLPVRRADASSRADATGRADATRSAAASDGGGRPSVTPAPAPVLEPADA